MLPKPRARRCCKRDQGDVAALGLEDLVGGVFSFLMAASISTLP